MRWLASFVINPAEPADIADDVALLVAALPDLDRGVLGDQPMKARRA